MLNVQRNLCRYNANSRYMNHYKLHKFSRHMQTTMTVERLTYNGKNSK